MEPTGSPQAIIAEYLECRGKYLRKLERLVAHHAGFTECLHSSIGEPSNQLLLLQRRSQELHDSLTSAYYDLLRCRSDGASGFVLINQEPLLDALQPMLFSVTVARQSGAGSAPNAQHSDATTCTAHKSGVQSEPVGALNLYAKMEIGWMGNCCEDGLLTGDAGQSLDAESQQDSPKEGDLEAAGSPPVQSVLDLAPAISTISVLSTLSSCIPTAGGSPLDALPVDLQVAVAELPEDMQEEVAETLQWIRDHKPAPPQHYDANIMFDSSPADSFEEYVDPGMREQMRSLLFDDWEVVPASPTTPGVGAEHDGTHCALATDRHRSLSLMLPLDDASEGDELQEASGSLEWPVADERALLEEVAALESQVQTWIDMADLEEADQCLGSGGNGKVTLAHFQAKPVAMKSITCDTVRAYKSALREILILQELQEARHVVHLVGAARQQAVGSRQLCVHICMELKQYAGMWRVLHVPEHRARFGFPEGLERSLVQRLSWARDVAVGLSEIHAVGIIHGDIKPGNVLISSELQASLADFGTSKKLLSDKTSVQMNRPTTMLYAAPEAMCNRMCPASDVFSFGCVLWELLSLEKPWQDVAPWAVLPRLRMRETLSREAIPLDTQSQVPDVVDVMQQCMAYEKRHRPTTDALIAVLDSAIAALAHSTEVHD